MRAILCLVLVGLSGCTLAFGAVGGVSASSANASAREQGKPATASVGARIVAGALVGAVIDVLILRASLDGCCPDLSGLNNSTARITR